MSSYYEELPPIAASYYATFLPENWKGIDICLPLLTQVMVQGGVWMVKADGFRVNAYRYTGWVTGVEWMERLDTTSLEEALAFVLCMWTKR